MKAQIEKKDWNDYWGNYYNKQRKIKYRTFLQELSDKNILGRTILDLGCGLFPITQDLSDRRHKKIYLDLSDGIYNNMSDDSNLFIKLDVHQLLINNQKEFKKYMKKLYKFLGQESFNNSNLFANNISYLDTVVYSDILNYIDYKTILTKIYKFMKIGSRKVIFNKINMGIYELFSPNRPKSNWEILRFLQLDLKMFIEYRYCMPIIIGDHEDNERATYIYIAKKK